MRTLTTPVANQANAAQSGWTELYDFYLRSAISTPWGTLSVIRLTTCPGGLSNFAPSQGPEPTGTQATSQTYREWPITREQSTMSRRTGNDRLVITASNVTTDFATMIAGIEWRDTPIIIRKVPLPDTVGSALTAADSVVVFSGVIQSAVITDTQIQFTCSSDLGTFQAQLPGETYHPGCRFLFGDDYCGQLLYAAGNYKTKTCASGSTTTAILSADLTEDTSSSTSYGTDQINALSDGSIYGSTESTGSEGYRVKTSHKGAWWLNGTASQWGNVSQGYWMIPDGQAGLANAALTPYLQINITGGGIQLPTWRFMGCPNQGRECLPRVIQIHAQNSGDGAYTHCGDFELPAVPGVFHEVRLPGGGPTKAQWRICIRSRWSTGFWQPTFQAVQAFTTSRHYWKDGYITFSPTTATAALQGLTRQIAGSYSGEIDLTTPLPVAPAAGDTFVIQRGCARTFNACSERGNLANYGGFPDIGQELIAGASGLPVTAPSGGLPVGGTGGRHTP